MGTGYENAAVVLANYFQFAPGQVLTNPVVLSRMLLWCKAGKGEVTINRRNCPLSVDDYIVLPWKHSITYKADPREPFLVAGIHVIPDHARNRKIEFQVAHTVDHPLAKAAWRKDTVIPTLMDIVRGVA